jgi:Spondin_N
MRQSIHLAALAAATLFAATTLPARADHIVSYEVTITNTTYNQRFTPLLLATHRPTVAIFQAGEPASPQLRSLAEEGNVAPLKEVLDGLRDVTATAAGNALLEPGKSITFRIKANPWRDRLSMAAMLIPTNDAFMALNAVGLPFPGGSTARFNAVAYDSGTEVNDELCTSIPGPDFAECRGSGGGARVGGGEGFVHVHRGMHGTGSFMAAARDWRNPVAKISVRLVR